MTLEPAQSAELEKLLSSSLQGEFFLDQYRCTLYSTDASIYQVQPAAVVVPRSRDDVVVALQIAAQQGLAVTARGGGTSLSGQSIGPGIVLDFSKYLNNILDLDAQSCMARVQPGVILDHLNSAAGVHQLQFGPDVATSSRATIGGMIGNNSAGARSVWQGKTVDHVAAMDVLLDDGSPARFAPLTHDELIEIQRRTDRVGHLVRQVDRIVNANRDEILRRYPRVLRRVSGYNLDEFVPACGQRIPLPPLVAEVRRREERQFGAGAFNLAKLIVGAEGTLATVTEAVLHLVPLPRFRGLMVLHFDSLMSAVGAIEAVLSCGPSAAELFDGEIVRLAERSLEYRHYLDFVVGRPESLLLVELCGESTAEVQRKADVLVDRVKDRAGLYHILPALDAETYGHIWACRKAALPLLLGVPGRRKPVAFVEDAAVAPQRLGEFVARFREIMARHGTDGAFYGHASVGCLHIRPLLDLTSRDDLAHLTAISSEVCALVVELEGSVSGEHGDGFARSYLNERLFGPAIYDAFKQIKTLFDPSGRLNPGKVVDGPSPVENLRYGADYRTMQVPTTLDFSRQGQFVGAAELCNGAGVCRKLRSGTMCPSFMATGDEEHSTRGRANALRLVLSGVLPPQEFTGKKLFETYDLCLQCKGCKAECPSNVDVAKLKMEFLSHYYAANGAPLGVKLLAHAATLNRLGSALSPLSNFMAAGPVAGLLKRTLGLDPRRPLPRFARQHFKKWFNRRRATVRPEAHAGEVVLLDDCLTSYCEPQVNRAATLVLEAAGYKVHLAGIRCCGRTLASKGFLTEAQRLARENIDRLLPWAQRGVPIVGCEPSCLLMLVDEYPDLVPGDAAHLVASRATLADTFLARCASDLPLRALNQSILLHGHCHQKALEGIAGSQQALAKIPGAVVVAVDSGCCGMAGSFGYEHYELSMQIGERVLLPAVRSHAGPIAAPGFSCRQQIQHGAGRVAKHPLELIADALAVPAIGDARGT